MGLDILYQKEGMMPTGTNRIGVLCLILLLVICGGLTTAVAQDFEFGDSEEPAVASADTSEVFLTWSGVTVVTKDGWNFPDATVSWVPGAETPRLRVLRSDGMYKDWDVFQIVGIRNAFGVDITQEVAAAIPNFGDESQALYWQSHFSEIGTPVPEDQLRTSLGEMAFKGLFSTAYGVCLSYGQPIGGLWYDGINGGLGILANVRIPTHKRTYLNLLVHHQWLGVEDFYIQDYFSDRIYRVESEYNPTSVFFLVGTYGPHVNTSSGHFFFEIGMGWTNHSFKVTVDGESASDSIGRIGSMLRLGYWAPVGTKTRLEFGVSAETKDGVLFHRDEPGGTIMAGYVGLMFF